MGNAFQPDHDFNIDKFSELLQKAKGGRSQSEFAINCNVSLAYLNRYIKKKNSRPPMPTTIKKIAAVAANNISYEELLNAAGYDPEKYLEFSPATPIVTGTLNSSNMVLHKIAYSTVLNALSQTELSWKLDKTDNSIKTFSISIDDEAVNRWYFSTHLSHTPSGMKIIPSIYYMYLFNSDADINSKYSIVTNDEDLVNFLCANPPYILNVLVSVILIDDSDLSVIREEYLNSSASYKEEDLDKLRLDSQKI